VASSDSSSPKEPDLREFVRQAAADVRSWPGWKRCDSREERSTPPNPLFVSRVDGAFAESKPASRVTRRNLS